MGISVTMRPVPGQHTTQKSTHVTTNRILDVLERYRLRQRDGTSDRNEEGRKRFFPMVLKKVEAKEPIQLVILAFPFKSPNNESKVIGAAPDKGEEIALQHLNGICRSIQDIYEPGADITIASDGIIYNDILGVPDSDVWKYAQTLKKISENFGFTHIRFIRLQDLLGRALVEPLTEEAYVKQAPEIRDKIIEIHTPAGYDVRHEIINNEDSAAKYRGYIKFLTKDLANTKMYETQTSKKAIKKRNEMVARTMMARAKAFAAAVQTNFDDYVRLSIHASSGSTKISISLFPHTSPNMTPWHATTVFSLNGSVATVHLDELEKSPYHELVRKDGVASYYRERSDLYCWDKLDVSFEPLYPTGILVTPMTGSSIPSLKDVDMDKIRCLAEHNSPVVLRGFVDAGKRVIANKASEAGGIRVAEGVGHDSPKLQMFISSSKDKTGSSFSSSRQLLEHLPDPLNVDNLSNRTFSARSNPSEQIPLIVPHPTLGTRCLRYQKTGCNTTSFNVDNNDHSILGIIDTLMYDRRVCYDHTWEAGDVIISDPVSTVCTFQGTSVECININ